MSLSIGVLHPGEMGITLATTLQASGHSVWWLAAGRSPATAARAASLQDAQHLEQLLERVQALVSVCPPAAAAQQAAEVHAAGFTGIYVDANAVAPQTATQIAGLFGSNYVDGGIIGPPALNTGSTRLYLSGVRAAEVAAWFSAGPMQAIALASPGVAASTLKMAYAAYTKGHSALLLAVNALADQAGVHDDLLSEWALSQPKLAERSALTAAGTSRKAWRFAGEMEEIAATFAAHNLPSGFHTAAAELYERMAELKDLPPADLQQVLRSLK